MSQIPEHVELEVLRLLDAGNTVAQIVRAVAISPPTVRKIRASGKLRKPLPPRTAYEPSPGVIRWWCEKFQRRWSSRQKKLHLTQPPTRYELPTAADPRDSHDIPQEPLQLPDEIGENGEGEGDSED